MNRKSPKIIVLATSEKMKGGIPSVIRAHRKGKQWIEFKCYWLATHIDRNAFYKIFFAFYAFVRFLFLMPTYDLVHIHLSEPPSAIRKLPFLLYAKLIGKKVIVHFHSYSIESTIHSKFDFIYKALFTKADLIIVLSQMWKNEVEKKFNLNNKIDVLYNPCDDPDYKTKFDKKNIILYAGILNTRKGYNDLIDAFSLITNRFSGWDLYLAGNGEIEAAKLKVKSINLENKIKILGWIDGDQKSKYFQQASIFCLPSYAEGFPMAVLDAWSYGIPVITTTVGGLIDVLEHKKNALINKPGDVQALSKNLELMISDKELRGAIANESINLALYKFNVDNINNQLSIIYKNLLKQTKNAK